MFLLITLSSLLALFFIAECVAPVFADRGPRGGAVARQAKTLRRLPAAPRKAARQSGFQFGRRRRKAWAAPASRGATRSREVKVA